MRPHGGIKTAHRSHAPVGTCMDAAINNWLSRRRAHLLVDVPIDRPKWLQPRREEYERYLSLESGT